jgi:hypothetical protein
MDSSMLGGCRTITEVSSSQYSTPVLKLTACRCGWTCVREPTRLRCERVKRCSYTPTPCLVR